MRNAGFEFEEHYFSEIDKYAVANYKYNFPNAKHIGSVTDIPNGRIRGIDIITFGSPCQDFSLAGKRKGLAGTRSSLIGDAIRLIADIRPSIFIWENVKGAFSSNNSEDFWAIIQAFTNIGGYQLEWQLLNTKWFLPQNRERIYLVGHLATPERSFRQVFPIRETNEIYHKRKQEKTSQIASTLNANDNKSWVGNFIKVGTFRTHKDGRGFREIKDGICPTIPASAREDGSGQPVIRQLSSDNSKTIRRLTPIECERLQGFPDNWTKYGVFDGKIKEISDPQRYKMIGNAVTVRVVEEIGKKLISLYE